MRPQVNDVYCSEVMMTMNIRGLLLSFGKTIRREKNLSFCFKFSVIIMHMLLHLHVVTSAVGTVNLIMFDGSFRRSLNICELTVLFGLYFGPP